MIHKLFFFQDIFSKYFKYNNEVVFHVHLWNVKETVTDKFCWYFCKTYVPVYQCYLLVETYVLEQNMCIIIKILHTIRLVLKKPWNDFPLLFEDKAVPDRLANGHLSTDELIEQLEKNQSTLKELGKQNYNDQFLVWFHETHIHENKY